MRYIRWVRREGRCWGSRLHHLQPWDFGSNVTELSRESSCAAAQVGHVTKIVNSRCSHKPAFMLGVILREELFLNFRSPAEVMLTTSRPAEWVSRLLLPVETGCATPPL
jgi:hypothetical protein